MAQPNRRETLKKGRRVPMTITLDLETHALLERVAELSCLNRSALIEQLIRKRAQSLRLDSSPAGLPTPA
jgi:predicted transcriptional regulator